MSSAEVVFEVTTTSLEKGQVQGVPKDIKTLLGDHDVFELWGPLDHGNSSFGFIARLASEIAITQSREGVVRASRRVNVEGPSILDTSSERLILYRENDLSFQLEASWNASLDLLQVFPVSDISWREDRQLSYEAVIHRLFVDSPFAVACAHDGDALQVIVLAAGHEDVWRGLLRAASHREVLLKT